MAGLVNTTSGYWKVNHVSVASGFSVDTTAKASFGMLVNRADQLYLEVENEAGLDYASGISIDSDVTVHDEIAAFTTEPNYANSDTFSVAKTLYEQRGSGIISVHIDGSTASSYSLGDGYTLRPTMLKPLQVIGFLDTTTISTLSETRRLLH